LQTKDDLAAYLASLAEPHVYRIHSRRTSGQETPGTSYLIHTVGGSPRRATAATRLTMSRGTSGPSPRLPRA
jgi:hypothetical protein